ncbi:transcriptional regulator NrdR [Candidatus Oleimmundimicrobium sp.]|uniref:transcriptional regulator NrdR n=1 Tax=Candidatus Oleimmundimicrobium sp. TaxID=3060597 RepID=UPI0027168FC4|nr:transcriptional regulator NrdR [Candidatus Oleimmundimicrobium sp.]MDO8885402.1 transcriptional regulator NrdR [Candidatus Oleimmundimicrobium sp.]
MKCPFCGSLDTRVVDSRATDSDDAIRRRRECVKCSQRFTTFERIEEIPLTVIKKDGTCEPFNRGKLIAGLGRATVKRHVTASRLEKMVSDIETQLKNEFKYEISSQELGEMILRHLKKIDKVAYIRFASVYREFKDIDEFMAELEKLQ